jgi:hypothetical protein
LVSVVVEVDEVAERELAVNVALVRAQEPQLVRAQEPQLVRAQERLLVRARALLLVRVQDEAPDEVQDRVLAAAEAQPWGPTYRVIRK